MGYRSIISLMPKTAPVDADAQAFLTAAGITDPTISGAINTLVVQMKADNIWTKMKAIYPMVGGTASTHKWNLKDPRDLDAAFRLVFSGGWTHSATGAKPNGANGLADTKIVPRTGIVRNNVHLSFYSRSTDTGGNQIDFGAFDGANISQISADYNYSGGGACARFHSTSGSGEIVALKASQPNSMGFYNSSRLSDTDFKFYKNGVLIGSNLANHTNLAPNAALTLSAGTNIQYSNKECAFASVGDGLTDTEAANLYTAVQAFQTTLSRNV